MIIGRVIKYSHVQLRKCNTLDRGAQNFDRISCAPASWTPHQEQVCKGMDNLQNRRWTVSHTASLASLEDRYVFLKGSYCLLENRTCTHRSGMKDAGRNNDHKRTRPVLVGLIEHRNTRLQSLCHRAVA
jgi:hypothetical protein